MNILITGGGCREPIDAVRCITNMSTGKTAAHLATLFEKAGESVTALMAAQAVHPSCVVKTFQTSSDLQKLLKKELSENQYDAIIHAAAVSDFIPSIIVVDGIPVPAGKNAGKIASSSEMTVTFKQAPKLAPHLRSWAKKGSSGKKTIIVCFKLTNGASQAQRMQSVAQLFCAGAADFVVSNDLTELHDGQHPFVLYKKPQQIGATIVKIAAGQTETALAETLQAILHSPTEISYDTNL